MRVWGHAGELFSAEAGKGLASAGPAVSLGMAVKSVTAFQFYANQSMLQLAIAKLHS